VELSAAAGLPVTDKVTKAWGTSTIVQIASLVENQRQAIEAIAGTAKELTDEPRLAGALRSLRRRATSTRPVSSAKPSGWLRCHHAFTDKGTARKCSSWPGSGRLLTSRASSSRIGLFPGNPAMTNSQKPRQPRSRGIRRVARNWRNLPTDGWDGATAARWASDWRSLRTHGRSCVLVYYLRQRFHDTRGGGAVTHPPRSDNRHSSRRATRWLKDWENTR